MANSAAHRSTYPSTYSSALITTKCTSFEPTDYATLTTTFSSTYYAAIDSGIFFTYRQFI